ncbi:hypothetical protein [Streptomyces sp. NBC_00996]|uniref:hypothetical protein n=1 Tax=Streptomyces sp. NBC_00996 TaxID=2903710 RepID=UPI00386BB1F2|nr:hypothetical protein OG390_17950 [Streptomyces sp. NBC_00996]
MEPEEKGLLEDVLLGELVKFGMISERIDRLAVIRAVHSLGGSALLQFLVEPALDEGGASGTGLPGAPSRLTTFSTCFFDLTSDFDADVLAELARHVRGVRQ